METLTRSFHQAAAVLTRFFGTLGALAIGFTLLVVGVAMSFTIVTLPLALIVELLGIAFVSTHSSRINRDSASSRSAMRSTPG